MQHLPAFKLSLAAATLLLFAGAADAGSGPADILAANKTATAGSAWDSKQALKAEYAFSGQGMTGPTQSVTDLTTGRYADSYDLGIAKGANGYDGAAAWSQDSSGAVTAQDGGDTLKIAINEAYRRANLWWRADLGGAAVTATSKSEAGASFDVLTVTPKGGKAFDAWFDSKTHLLARIEEMQGSQKVVSTNSNYAPVDGVQIAGQTMISTGNAKYDQTLTLTKAQFVAAQKAEAFAAPKVTVADFAIAGGAKDTVLPFKLINNHIYAEAKVNGQGPFVFIFDTGGFNVLTPNTAKALGLKAEGNMEATGSGEGSMEAGFTKVGELRVGNALVKDQVFAVVPLDALAGVEGVDMPGMVGFETFRRFVTRIDYGAKTITLIDPKAFDPKDSGTPVKFKFNGHIPEVQGTFEGIPATFDIDTGSRAELTLTRPFAEKYEIRARHPKGIEGVEGWGVGGPSRGYITRGASLTIGPVKVTDIVTSMVTQKKGAFAGDDYSGNIGGGVLKRFIVTFDYEHQTMYLKPLPGKPADTGTFDRSGMWINVTESGFRVMDVVKSGPAELAGLKADDILSAVDGKPAASIKLYDLRKRLRNDAPGTKITFTVTRDNAAKNVTVVLKDQF